MYKIYDYFSQETEWKEHGMVEESKLAKNWIVLTAVFDIRLLVGLHQSNHFLVCRFFVSVELKWKCRHQSPKCQWFDIFVLSYFQIIFTFIVTECRHLFNRRFLSFFGRYFRFSFAWGEKNQFSHRLTNWKIVSATVGKMYTIFNKFLLLYFFLSLFALAIVCRCIFHSTWKNSHFDFCYSSFLKSFSPGKHISFSLSLYLLLFLPISFFTALNQATSSHFVFFFFLSSFLQWLFSLILLADKWQKFFVWHSRWQQLLKRTRLWRRQNTLAACKWSTQRQTADVWQVKRNSLKRQKQKIICYRQRVFLSLFRREKEAQTKLKEKKISSSIDNISTILRLSFGHRQQTETIEKNY